MFNQAPKTVVLDYFGDSMLTYEFVKFRGDGTSYTEVRLYEFYRESDGKYMYKLKSVNVEENIE